MLATLLLAATSYFSPSHGIASTRNIRCAPSVCQQQEIVVSAVLDDERVEKLFAWICRAFDGDARYNNLMMAFAAIFGEHDDDSAYTKLVNDALNAQPPADALIGDAVSLRDREQGSLGAMGAGQWTGQWRTRPHSLLDVRELGSVDEWVKSLPRGARRTLAKANANADAGKITVQTLAIRGDEVAPHATLAHFKCLVAHEVRLLSDGPNGFFDAISQAIGRYTNCVSQAGEIREYRDAEGRVIAFAQEATKGKVIRGQWYYATDEAASLYVWFHSVQELVKRAIADEGIDYADLGPSGTDAFSQLKEKYGFDSVDDWHTVADYRGPFRYEWGEGESWAELDPPDWLFDDGLLAEMRRRMQ